MRRMTMGTSLTLALTLTAGAVLSMGTMVQAADDDMMSQCTHEPRVLEDMLDLFGTVHPEGAGEAASLEANDAAMGETPDLPRGHSADQMTRAAAQESVSVLIACFNAGHLLAGWGGVTDEFLVSQIDSAIFDEDFVAQIEAGPVPLPDDQHTRILDFGDTLVLEDGDVAVVAHYHGPAQPGEGLDGVETDMFILRNVDGDWLLNAVIENLESTHGLVGTEAP